ncbi:MAG TPA: hypothetical protein VGD74_04845 [Vulgatibacter sp.]
MRTFRIGAVALLLVLGACGEGERREMKEGPDHGIPLAAGTCDDPLEPSGLEGDGVHFEASVDNFASDLEGVCGGKGREVVHRFVAPSRGTMAASLEAERGFVVYARRSCASPDGDRFCAGTQEGEGMLRLEAGEEIFLVVDSPAIVAEPTYRLNVRFVPTLDEGAACDPDGVTGVCAKGLYCGWTALTCLRNNPPTLEWADATFRNGGGGDARVRVRGTDPDGNLAGMAIRFFDEAGERVQVSGLGELYTAFDATARQATEFSWDRVLNRLAPRYPAARSVEVELVDGAGARSNTLTLEFGVPADASTGESCDPDGWTATCGEGDLCQVFGLDEPLCEAQEPPVLAQARAYRTAAGSLAVVASGSDPNADIIGWFGSLLKEDGEALAAFPRNAKEGTSGFDSSQRGSRDIEAVSTWSGIIEYFPEAAKLRLSLVDSGQNRSEAVEVEIEDVAEVEAGEACDPFMVSVTCGENLSCATSVEPEPACVDRAAARRQKCDEAPTLRPGETVAGVLGGDDLWTPFAECSPISSNAERHEKTEAVVKLVLDEPVTTLVLTTDLPGTRASHTLVYALSSCESEEIVACHDGYMAGIARSTLTMKNVLPGTWYVVVDTTSGRGAFELRAEIE